MKKIIPALLTCLLVFTMTYSQEVLFREIGTSEMGGLSQKALATLNRFEGNETVLSTSLIRVNRKVFAASSFRFWINNMPIVTTRKDFIKYDDTDLSWFGVLEDETGIFFTVSKEGIASKFYWQNTPCLIIPLQDDIHVLVKYKNSGKEKFCGTPNQVTGQKQKKVPEKEDPGILKITNDNNCTLRLLWVVTAQAEPEIPMSLELAARMLQDETNLAYLQSEITYRMEIARVVRTNYVETTNYTSATTYGQTFSYPSDLVNLSNGSGQFSNIPGLRNLYNADVVVLVRSEATNSTQGFYGIAFGVPTGTYTLNPDNAFAIISTEYMIAGRYTFAHEIGHIQGARHDDHVASPDYARGYVFTSPGSLNRTIMAIGTGCDPANGCRVQFFSNPDVTFNGIPVGIAGERNNALRINETARQILNHRQSSILLNLSAETFENEILARHLAINSISTNNNAVIANSGSRLSMRAGSEISLLPGFHSQQGSEVSIKIEGCAYVPTSEKPVKSEEMVSVSSRAAFNAEPAFLKQITIYPNPAQGYFVVQLNQIPALSTIQLINPSGITLYSETPEPGTNRIEFKTHLLPRGLYLIRLITEKSTITRKMVLQ